MFVSTQAAGPSRVPSPIYCNSHGSSDGMRTVFVAGLQGDNLMGVQLLGSLNQSIQKLGSSGSLPTGVDLFPAIGPGGMDGLGHSPSTKAGAIDQAFNDLKDHLKKVSLFVHVRGPDGPMAVSPFVRLLAERRSRLLPSLSRINLSGVSFVEQFQGGSLAARIEGMGIPVVEFFVGQQPGHPGDLRGLTRGLCELAGYGDLLEDRDVWPEPPELLCIEQDGILTLRAESQGIFTPSSLLGVDLYGQTQLGKMMDPLTGAVHPGPEGPLGARVLALRHAGLVRVGDALAQLAWPIDW